jgi:polysaccharide export outer membrane protein
MIDRRSSIGFAIKGLRIERSKVMRKIFGLGIVCLTLVLGATAFAQDNGGAAGNSAPSSSTSSGPAVVTGAGNSMSRDEGNAAYRIGPGDVLDIRVFNRPQLSREARVDNEGLIQMPLLEAPIKAACLTESELSKTIATAYLKYQRNPYVSVFIKEFSSQPVAVIGAVEKPGQIILRRRMRLFDAITVAGGPSKLAGSTVEIAHTGHGSICDGQPTQADPDPDDVRGGFVAFTLKATLRGDERSNPWLQPGDYVRVPEAENVMVVGNVHEPKTVALQQAMTVSEAIARAGGPIRDTKLNQVRILRAVDGSMERQSIPVDLVAINKHKAPDILLMPNDIVDVPEDKGAAMRTKIINALTGGLGSLPYLIR